MDAMGRNGKFGMKCANLEDQNHRKISILYSLQQQSEKYE